MNKAEYETKKLIRMEEHREKYLKDKWKKEEQERVEINLSLEKKRLRKKLKKLIKEGGTTHVCDFKDCSCYMPNVEDQNFYLIRKTEMDEYIFEKSTKSGG